MLSGSGFRPALGSWSRPQSLAPLFDESSDQKTEECDAKKLHIRAVLQSQSAASVVNGYLRFGTRQVGLFYHARALVGKEKHKWSSMVYFAHPTVCPITRKPFMIGAWFTGTLHHAGDIILAGKCDAEFTSGDFDALMSCVSGSKWVIVDGARMDAAAFKWKPNRLEFRARFSVAKMYEHC